MKALVLLEAWNVVESALTSIVWQMQTDSPIHSNHKHSHIVADTHSSAYSQLLVELIKLEGLERGKIGILHPDITGIQEQRSFKLPEKSSTLLCIQIQLQISRLVDEVDSAIISFIFTRTQFSDSPSSHRVGTT